MDWMKAATFDKFSLISLLVVKLIKAPIEFVVVIIT